MSWSASLPSATTTLANAAPWFTALFDEFRIWLYIGVGVVAIYVALDLLPAIFYRAVGLLSRERRMEIYRQEHRNYLAMDKQNQQDFELWRKTQR